MKLLIAVALSFIGLNAYAAKPNLVWCNNCTDSQMQAAALRTPVGNTTYIGDPIRQVVKAYEVYIDVEDTNPPTRTKVADDITPDQSLAGSVADAIAYYNTKPIGWVKRITVYTNKPTVNDIYVADPHVGVYDIVNAGRNQNYADAWLNSGLSPVATVALLLGHVVQGFANFNVLNLAVGPALYVPVHFEDGSVVDAVYDLSTGALKIDPSTAIDSHGNTVPYLGLDGLIHNLGGLHNFDGDGNPSDMNNFLNQLATVHVPVFVEVPPSSQHGWACVKSGDGPSAVYTCQRY
ncbi:MAG: hypothetical protein ACREPN_11995 [Rudaea sp.]